MSSASHVVLCTDDEDAILRLLQFTLSAHGYIVLSAYNGVDALELVASARIDAVVLDYSLPEMNGAELARKIKAVHPRVPIILFSGVSHLRNSMPPYVDAFVDKAEGPDILLMLLKRLLSAPGDRTKLFRKHPRSKAHLSIEIIVNRQGALSLIHGFTTTIGEGGTGGIVDGNLVPGELVLMQIFEPQFGRLESRAKVCYRDRSACGFEFLDVTPAQRESVRRFCQQRSCA